MSKFLKLLSIVAIVALIAVPAFAEVQNVKVSGDIDSKAIYRANYDLGKEAGSSAPDKDTWFMTTSRVQVDADLTDNVSTCLRLLNERDWDNEGNTTNDIDLDLASVKMKEMFYAPLTLTIGRQNLRFGSGLVVGDPDTNDASAGNATAISAPDLSSRKSFDAIRATMDYNPLTIDLILSKIDAGTIGSKNNNDDTNLYGVNAAYKFNKYNSEAEAYMFTRVQRSADTTPSLTDTNYVYGIRGSLEPISKLVVNGELAMQDGDYVIAAESRKIDRSAWAADAAASFAIDYKWSPTVGLAYAYRSGIKSEDEGNVFTESKYKAWDTMYEDQTHGIVANRILDANNDGGDSNSQIISASVAVVPIQDMTVSVDYYHFMLAQKWKKGSTRTMGGTTFLVSDEKGLGSELDVSLAYDYTEDVKLGLTAGYFMPGPAFDDANDKTASTVMADVKVSF
jgi:hypothetical protein